MAEVTVRNVVKRYGSAAGHARRQRRHRRRRVRRPRRPLRLRQVHAAADDRRARGDLRRRDQHRRPGGQRRDAQGPRHRHGVPELRALPAQDRRRQHGLLAQDQGRAEGRDRGQGEQGRRRSSISASCSTAIPKQLSGGQRQRVAMGRAIVRDPQVFLFDEPLSNLDAKLRVAMRVEIKELHQRLGTTIVYVTHDQIEAMTMADKIVVMRDGRVEQIGAPLDLYDNPGNVFVAGFIGSPAMNFIKGRIDAERRQAGLRLRQRVRAAGRRRQGRRPASRSSTASVPSISTSAPTACRRRSRCWSRPAPRRRSSPSSARTRSTPSSRTGSTSGPAKR